MNMRPVPTRWFELITARDDLTHAVETLAHTGSVELEMRSDTNAHFTLPDLQEHLDEYHKLARRYHEYWPLVDLQPETMHASPARILSEALLCLHRWAEKAAPLVQRLESLISEGSELQLIHGMLLESTDEELDFSAMGTKGPIIETSLFVLPEKVRIKKVPALLLLRHYSTDSHEYYLAMGKEEDVMSLGAEVAALKGHELALPGWLNGRRPEVIKQLEERLTEISQQGEQLKGQINGLCVSEQIAKALGDVKRMEWFMTHVSSLPVTENFAWVTGWTSDLSGELVNKALDESGVNAIIHFPDAPAEKQAPMVMNNPWWAQPFEMFSNMLGTPGNDEADPSKILAILVPLLFGYMFGDLGHGLVLLLAGIFLSRRFPITRILIANGLSAMLFGFVFGSVFGREDLIPALWLNPLEDPLPVMFLPLGGGVVILLLGLLLNAFESYWRKEFLGWLQVEAAVLVLYVSLIFGFFYTDIFYVSALALLWYFAGNLLQSSASPLMVILTAVAKLLESVSELLINTFSFIRVGAFALAHAGLSLAFFIMSESTENLFLSALVLVLGNVIVIFLEGLVVTIQTTRLILFEFFIRFLRGSGRVFHPLAAPTEETEISKK
jgi:V/A-type H+/Na+-transporting ATPase subunit I